MVVEGNRIYMFNRDDSCMSLKETGFRYFNRDGPMSMILEGNRVHSLI